MIDNLLLDTLRRGGTILYPTDTVWGLGCDATNADAIEKIYRIKQRDHAKSMLLLCAGEEMVRRYVPAPSEDALQLLLHSDRPTTVIFPHAVGLADNLTAADGSIAIRVPRANAGVTDSRGAEFCHELLLAWDRPIVSTSANLSGEPSPTCYKAASPRWGTKKCSRCWSTTSPNSSSASKPKPPSAVKPPKARAKLSWLRTRNVPA